MRTRHLTPSWKFRRVVSGVLLGSYLVTALGVPLPAGVGRACDSNHPCSTRACGCDSLEQALGHCCCTPAAEKRAWVPDCCSAADGAEPPSCCKPRGSARTHAVDFLVTLNVQRCRGQGPAWVDAEVAPPPPPDVRWQHEMVCTGWLTPADAFSAPLPATPTEPPPRVA